MEVRSLAGTGASRVLKSVGIMLLGLLAGGQSADAQVAPPADPFEPTKEMQNPRDLDKGCTPHEELVEIPTDTGTEHEVYGELCLPTDADGNPVTPKTVQLLLHGITYGTYYWDFPDQKGTPGDESKKYSWVDYMTRAGYATFNIDHIEGGRSDHPPSVQVTLQTNGLATSPLVCRRSEGKTKRGTGSLARRSIT